MDKQKTRLTACFVIEEGSDCGREFSVSDILEIGQRPAFVIGSNPRCHLRLDAPEVASGHAVVTLNEGTYRIESRFPNLDTWVNGGRIEGRIPLTHHDTVQIGDITLRFLREERATPPVLAPPQSNSAAVPPPPEVQIVSPVAAVEIAETAPTGTIYRPQQSDKPGASFPLPLVALALAAIAGIVGIGLIGWGTIGGQEQQELQEWKTAFNDGSAAMVMFYADW